MNAFALRAAELTEDQLALAAAVTALLNARVAIAQQIADLDRKVMGFARNNAQAQQFITVPGIGPVTALAFLQRSMTLGASKRSRSVGAYVGLTTRRYASGEIDWTRSNLEVRRKMLAAISTKQPTYCLLA
jgi:transposase